MAKFSRKNTSMENLEEKVKHLEVFDIPINIQASDYVIGEGSSAVVFKYSLRGKYGACKKFKCSLPRKAILKAANGMVQLKNENVVRFRGFSCRPSAIIMEHCYIELGNMFNLFLNLNYINYINYIRQELQNLCCMFVIGNTLY